MSKSRLLTRSLTREKRLSSSTRLHGDAQGSSTPTRSPAHLRCLIRRSGDVPGPQVGRAPGPLVPDCRWHLQLSDASALGIRAAAIRDAAWTPRSKSDPAIASPGTSSDLRRAACGELLTHGMLDLPLTGGPAAISVSGGGAHQGAQSPARARIEPGCLGTRSVLG